ncbi:phosphoribosyltransferase [Candidatus Peregrinibacteria bacterium]|nr:phosphoribosyltransferase [Candidatus Peregrinibacteria bacterium]
MTTLPFHDRTQAGEELGKALLKYTAEPDTLILALVRGGVVIGRAVADVLDLPLYPYIVRKLGHPGHREFGLGAIAEGGATYLNEAAMIWNDLHWQDMEPVIEEETAEMERRRAAYMVEARPPLAGKTILLTDDGAATGSTLFAAIDDLRKAKVKKIIVALPVAAPDTAEELRKRADEVVILATPSPFNAVGQWYLEFPQVEDAEVLQTLR